MLTPFARVLRCAERWRVPVTLGETPVAGHGWHLGPSLRSWIYWPERRIVASRHFFDAIDLAHELAHCIAPEPPDEIDEVRSCLFAVECAIGRACGLRFAEQVAGWTIRDEVDDEVTWDALTLREKRATLRRSREAAIECGVLDVRGRMTYALSTNGEGVGR